MNRIFSIVRLMAVVALTMTVTATHQAIAKPRLQTRTVKITERGYEPETVKLRRGVRARITFLRTTDHTCGKDVVVPDFGIKRELPLNQPVVINFTPNKKGEFSFTCGMNMMRGKLIVQ